MNEITSPPEPSTAKYIGVWILTGIFASIGILIVDKICVALFLDLNNITASSYWLLGPIIQYAAWAMIFVGIYSYFNTLKMGKVIPWVVGLGALGILSSIGQTYSAFSQAGLPVPSIFIISMLGSFGFAVFLTNKYFKTKQPHRY